MYLEGGKRSTRISRMAAVVDGAILLGSASPERDIYVMDRYVAERVFGFVTGWTREGALVSALRPRNTT